MKRILAVLTLALPLVVATPSRADEGMWTLDHLPVKQLQSSYGFTPTPAWVEHLQKSAVNFGGGSGAFVSADGLVLTNHHVALSQLHKMSSPQHDYVRDGFYARSRVDEVKCPDLEVKVLWSMEDVTAQVLAAVDPDAAPEKQAVQRRAVLAKLEQRSLAKTGLKTESVELYDGGEYWLYRYRTFTDVRLVHSPEEQAAFYGGDPDNFSYPRHDLDYTFFRVYDHDRPLRPQHWIRWSPNGVGENELVFVIGHPGRTGRMSTVAQLDYERDVQLPQRIAAEQRRLAAYREYGARGPEQARQVVNGVRGLTNNLKREYGFLDVLRDPAFTASKRAAEDSLRARVARTPATADVATAWDRIAAAVDAQRARGVAASARETQRASRLVDFANTLVRMTAEVKKPNEQRLREYRDGNLESMRFALFSPAPIYPALDEHVLASQLAYARERLGDADPWVKLALGGRTPQQVAHDVVAGTKLADVEERRRLLAGGTAAIAASTDPAIVWARALDPLWREERTWREEHVQSVESFEGGRIARARFALDGHDAYPDATGTLRLAYGKTEGYTQLTTEVPWKTTFHGLFDRARSFDQHRPFQLPDRVDAAAPRIRADTPLNFVCTDDIIGGNSGSPIVDRNGEYVGLVFDGNIQSFLWDYGWSDTQARCVAVDSRAIVEALRTIYDMPGLADELTGEGPAGAR